MGTGGTEAGTRGVKIPHQQVPREWARSYSRIARGGDPGAVPPRSYGYDGRHFGRIRVLATAIPARYQI